jgi:hypothetical protein
MVHFYEEVPIFQLQTSMKVILKFEKQVIRELRDDVPEKLENLKLIAGNTLLINIDFV